MTFRTRLVVTFLLAVLLPMIALALFIRVEMTSRLTRQYERRVESLVSVIEEDLSHEGQTIATSIAVLRQALVNDNRFRRAAVDRDPDERRYLLNYAGNAMQITSLSMLQIQDDRGRIISSGHFRNEFDRVEPEVPALLASTPEGTALVQARTPDAPFLALAHIDSVQMGNKRFTIIAGIRVEERFLARLARDAEMTVDLVYPGGELSSLASPSESVEVTVANQDADAIVRELSVPFIDSARREIAVATFRVSHQLTELHELRFSVNRWFLIAVVAAALSAVMLVGWLSSRISRPLEELANKTSHIDLDRLDIDFKTERKDEIGGLSRVLGAMTDRLQASATQIKDAERRATLGQLARQVNHDIKNGLTPIRNVFRHLVELAGSNPRQLPQVLQERQGTLDSSIGYLETLASNYARLSPRMERARCDVNDIVRHVVTESLSGASVELEMRLGEGAFVLGDPVSLRRIIENLVDNAIDSLDAGRGRVTISTARATKEDERPHVQIVVADTGVGMNGEERAKVFDDFYTTKDHGTGLGLSIVRRLVMDLNGSIDVESEAGKGSRFLIDLPAV